MSSLDANAQDRTGRLDRQLEQIYRDQVLRIDQSVPADRRALLDYGALLSFSYLSLDDSLNNNHVLRQYDFIAYARANFDGIHEFFLRGRTGYQDFNHQDSFNGKGDEAIDPEFDRAYYRFNLRRALEAKTSQDTDSELTLQVGRDLVYWGNGLVLSEVLDGVLIRFASAPINIDLIAGVTPKETLDFDSSRPNFDDHTYRGFYGVQLSRQIQRHRVFAYALIQRDYNDNEKLDFPDQNIQTRFNYNSNYFGLGSQGALNDRLLYGVEMAYETGSGLSNSYVQSADTGLAGVPQSDEDLHAFAADVRLDYFVGDEQQTRFSVEGIYASGDTDRLTSTSDTFGGNQSNSDDNAFNAFGFLNTGLAFAPQVSNLILFRAGASTMPLPRMPYFERFQIGVDAFVFAKARSNAPIDEPTDEGSRYLGWEPDLFINWQITTDITLAVRYGIFFPGDAIQGEDHTRQYFFAGVTYAF